MTNNPLTNGTALVFEPFTRAHWSMFNGCESFPWGTEPLCAALAVEGVAEPLLVIIDANGLFVAYDCDDAATPNKNGMVWDQAHAAFALAHLRHGMTVADIESIPGAEEC